jgi:protein-S-isoprenylcysteine O-methyltransferase Ste14
MFLFISIPMAEKRLAANKSDFERYYNETRVLLPIPRRKKTG